MDDSNAFSFWQLNRIIQNPNNGFYYIIAEHAMQEQIAKGFLTNDIAVYNYSGKENKFKPEDIFRFLDAHPDKHTIFILNFQIPFLGKEVKPMQEDYFKLNICRDIIYDYSKMFFFFMTSETEYNLSLVATDFWEYAVSKIRFESVDKEKTIQEIENLPSEKDNLHFVPEIEERLARYQEKMDEYLDINLSDYIDISEENNNYLLIAARDLNYFAELYVKIGNYKEAEDLLLKAIEIREKIIGFEHPDTATLYYNIGFVYRRAGDYNKALEFDNKALEIREKALGLEHPDTAFSYNSIGLVYRRMGDYDKALEYYNQALEIREKILGFEHPDTAASYKKFGAVYRSKGDYNKALLYYNKTLDITEKTFGLEHPNTATLYNNIGGVYYSTGDYNKALEYFNKALEIREKKLGNKHPNTKAVIENIKSIKAKRN